eukprot:CAMPEP_0118653190 /NCGR_PEP_ID=MMETSP0785-20121206/11705_1 /TAXON_ID=91992 /ORGANISM="Bolidomonas pacifica, Strain CCMP 1866" /LENGTH=151 /DNA_ID=CAMNT_0006545729 /DNA_START=207 /DNA_END=659 /DNA_ORIENTATION=-
MKVSDIDKLGFHKTDLIEAIVRGEEDLIRSTAAGWGGLLARGEGRLEFYVRWIYDNDDIVYIALVVCAATAMMKYTDIANSLRFRWEVYRDSNKLIFSQCWGEGTPLGILLFLVLLALDFLTVWMRVTIIAGWVTPRRYAGTVRRIGFPTP